MEIIICIYSITNIINGKKYIGSAIDFRRRKRVHLGLLKKGKHHSYKLQNGFNKYGESNFLFEILEKLDSVEQIIKVEQTYIDNLLPEYNVTLVAGLNSHLGLKRTQETKDKIRKSNTGKPVSKETREKLRQINLGKKQSQETKDKKRNSMKNSKIFQNSVRSKERIDKIKNTRLKSGGYNVSTEQREKIKNTLRSKNIQSAISKKICKFDMNLNLIEIYPSMSKAEVFNNLKKGSLRYNISKKKKEKYKGFIWKIIANCKLE